MDVLKLMEKCTNILYGEKLAVRFQKEFLFYLTPLNTGFQL